MQKIQFDENEKKNEKNLNIWYLDGRWFEVPHHLVINKHISVILSPYLLYAAYCIVTHRCVGGIG